MSHEPSADGSGDVFAAHSAVHAIFDGYVDALFAGLEGGLATLALAIELRRALLRHLDVEERTVLPRCRGASAEAVANVRRDHRLLRSGLERLEEMALLRAFQRVDARLLRHTLVHFERLLHHHDEREAGQLYGPLSRELAPEACAELDEQLARVAPQAVPTRETRAAAEHPVVAALAARYRAWLAGAEPRPVPLGGADLPERVEAALPKLLARDDHVLRRDHGLAAARPRERAASDMLIEVSLRSTLTFVLEALLERQ